MDAHNTTINSSLNLSILPSHTLQDQLSSYIPKFSVTLTKMICQSKGLKSTDERVYKVVSIAAERLIHRVLSSLKDVNVKSLKDAKNEIVIAELLWALDELGVNSKPVTVLQEGRS
eukprot:TRINITY_DN6989_c0_g1_i1.p2 TRINITY_DN6989_c0_g1~~TRINITY_DN6989_c0_g1_i1.p2  ORF type:complete len:116 (-),score=28.59 TRINITY_DN6989_c0_g1_i1:53-400(-)